MCGLCGVLLFRDGERVERPVLDAMTDRMTHRGPDGRGVWSGGPIALGHRRLAIIDPAGGAQPMTNETGSVRLVCNGEIYNHRELRAELGAKGHRFRTRSDNEVAIHLYEEHGPGFVRRLNGMYALALWDAERQRLTLARDRLGIKPLFYYRWPGGIAFASELHALLAHPAVPREVDPEALQLYLDHEFVPAPRSMIGGVRKLRPAELLEVGARGEVASEVYWRCRFEPKAKLGVEDAADGFAERLRRAVRRQLMTDVPLGAFLSGGLDSSALVYWMREEGADPLRTFSIGFDAPDYDELPYAREVARTLGTDHHEEVLTPDLSSLVEDVTAHLDEPLGDVSALPTYLVSRVARRSVTVCLSGDGGDELLAGYERHLASRLARATSDRLPPALRRALAPLAARLPPAGGKKPPAELVRRFVAGAAKDRRGGQMRWQTFLPEAWLARIYTPAMAARAAAVEPFAAVLERAEAAAAAGALDRELAVELGLYLPDDILTKLDRMSMAVSLEARVPFLDHELVEFAAALPERFKMRRGRGKFILRRAMRGRLPRRVLTRRKQGFGMPVKRWLRRELYGPVAEAFASRALAACPWLEPRGLQAMLDAHRDGAGDHSHPLWSLFVFARWLERVSEPAGGGAVAERPLLATASPTP